MAESRHDDRFLYFVVLSALLTRAYALYATRGFLHPDNLFQLLEPAHRLVFGYGMIPWEFVYGMRSWFQPLLISLVFKLCLAVGVGDMSQLIFANRLLTTLASLALLFVVYEAASMFYDRKAAIYALFFAVFSPLLWLWSADVNYHIPSTLYAMIATMLFYRGWDKKSKRDYLLSGASLGVAFMFRFDSVLFALPFTLFAVGSRRTHGLPYFFLGLFSVVFLQGVMDYYTWGSFLHSPITFLDRNIIRGNSTMFGTSPFYYYMGVLGLHLTFLFLLPYAVERKARFSYLLLNAASYLAIFSILAHKEMRFIIPVLPLLSILAGRGMEKAASMYGRWMLYIICIITVLGGAMLVENFGWKPHWVGMEAMSYVRGRNDVTGVAYYMPWCEGGGYTYLHKRIPMVLVGDEAYDPLFNHIRCGKPDMGLIGFQCSPMDEVIAEKGINYLAVDNSMVGELAEDSGFVLLRRFDNVLVYRRAE